MDETTIQLIGAVASLISSLGVIGALIFAGIRLVPERQQAQAETGADIASAQLDGVRTMETALKELRAQVAEQRVESANAQAAVAKIERERHEEAIVHSKELLERNEEREQLKGRIDEMEGKYQAERKARESMEKDFAALKEKNREQQARIDALEDELDKLRKENAELKESNAELARENKRLWVRLNGEASAEEKAA